MLWFVVCNNVSLRGYNMRLTWKVFCFPRRATCENFSLWFLRSTKAGQKRLFSLIRIELNKWKILKNSYFPAECRRKFWDEHLLIYLFIHSILIELQLWERQCSHWCMGYTAGWPWPLGGIGPYLEWGQRGFSARGNSVSIGKEWESAEFVWDKGVWRGRSRSKDVTAYFTK